MRYVYRNNDGFLSESTRERIQTLSSENQGVLGKAEKPKKKGVWLSGCFVPYVRAALPQRFRLFQSYRFLVLAPCLEPRERWEWQSRGCLWCGTVYFARVWLRKYMHDMWLIRSSAPQASPDGSRLKTLELPCGFLTHHLRALCPLLESVFFFQGGLWFCQRLGLIIEVTETCGWVAEPRGREGVWVVCVGVCVTRCVSGWMTLICKDLEMGKGFFDSLKVLLGAPSHNASRTIKKCGSFRNR